MFTDLYTHPPHSQGWCKEGPRFKRRSLKISRLKFCFIKTSYLPLISGSPNVTRLIGLFLNRFVCSLILTNCRFRIESRPLTAAKHSTEPDSISEPFISSKSWIQDLPIDHTLVNIQKYSNLFQILTNRCLFGSEEYTASFNQKAAQREPLNNKRKDLIL